MLYYMIERDRPLPCTKSLKDTMQEADEQMLEQEIVTGGYEACRGIVRHLDGLLKEFKCRLARSIWSCAC